MLKGISSFGDQAIICDFGEEVNQGVNGEVIALFKILQNKINNNQIDGIKNCVPSYNKLVINFDLNITTSKSLISFINTLTGERSNFNQVGQKWNLPVCYDEEFGIDQLQISKQTGISVQEIIEMHQQTNFYIYMIGFMPGLPYMGDLDSKLHVPRLKTPRVEISKGSVIIAEQFCGIFPRNSPCGWSIIGKTPVVFFNQDSANKPSLLSPGDLVQFYSISKKDFENFDMKNF